MALNVGGIIRLTYQVKDAAGAATNPSTVTLSITQPDGTVAAGTVPSSPSTGLLQYDFAATQAGLHSVHWATTGPTTAEDDMFVAEAPARMLVSVDEAIGQLRAAGIITSDADREQLQQLCLDATELVELETGKTFVRRTVTETHSGGCSAIMLRKAPVLSVTSVTVSGVAFTGYVVDPVIPMLRAGSTTGYYSWFTSGLNNVVVVYQAGYADPPKAARLRARQYVQALHQASQQAFHPALDESSPEAFAAAGIMPTMPPGYAALIEHGVA